MLCVRKLKHIKVNLCVFQVNKHHFSSFNDFIRSDLLEYDVAKNVDNLGFIDRFCNLSPDQDYVKQAYDDVYHLYSLTSTYNPVISAEQLYCLQRRYGILILFSV